jgi:ABC-type branched-subunit amino acid transport system ATPase component
MIHLHDASVDIVGVTVLRRVSLKVPPGSRIALIGRNGAGKTTTLRTLMGLIALRDGSLTIDGADCRKLAPHRRANMGIGYAPEERRLFGSFSVRENITLPAEVLRLPAREVARRLDAVFALLPELRDLAERRAAGLSGGQGKMVALGRAIMVGTRAILLDEPFQGLAPALALRYAESLARLKVEIPDVAILITESSPELLRSLVEATFVIERGEISQATQ